MMKPAAAMRKPGTSRGPGRRRLSPKRAAPPPETVPAAARRVLAAQLAAVEANIPGARAGRDPERVHELRVATRRMRAALRVFRKVLPRRETRPLRDELRWMAGEVAAVRDLDVQIAQLRDGYRPATVPRAAAKGAFLEWLLRRRASARSRLLRALRSPRCRGLLDAARALVAGLETHAGRPRGKPMPAFAARRLQKGLRRLLRAGRRLGPSAPAPRLHGYRIRCKRLRYAAEFAGRASGAAAAELAARCRALQDALGLHQDAIVGQRLLRRFPAPASLEEAGPSALAGWYLARAEASRRRFFTLLGRLDSKRVGRRLLKHLKALPMIAGGSA